MRLMALGQFVHFVTRFPAEISGKQRLRDHVEREVHHVDRNVALLAGAPAVAHADRFLNHRAGVFRNALAMKAGLRHLPLRAMLCSLGSDHAFAQQHFRALHRALFDEVVVLDDQDFADVVRMIQEDDVVPSDFVVRDVAVFLGQLLKKQDGIRGAELAESEPEEVLLKAGRVVICRGAGDVALGYAVPGCSCHLLSLLVGLDLPEEEKRIQGWNFPENTESVGIFEGEGGAEEESR